jgi:hypothetical protein
MLAAITVLSFICAPISPPGLTLPGAPMAAETDATVVVEQSYGLQILAMDGVGIALLVAGGSSDSEALGTIGLLTMGFGPAVVHAAHGHADSAVASALMRPALTIGGVYMGAAMADCGGDHDEFLCGLGEAMIGGLIGYGTSVAIDASYLARSRRTTRTPRWIPTASASSSGVHLGVAGTF